MEETSSAQDIRLLETAIGGSRSGEALSKATSGLLSPEESVLRLKQLLREDNILDAIEERRLFFWKARRFLQKAEEEWDDGVKNAGRLALDALKLAESFSHALDDLNTAQIRYDEKQTADMVAAIKALCRVVIERYPVVPESDLDEIVLEAVPEALGFGSA